MSRKYKFSDQDKLYFVSFAVVYWIDVFTRMEYKNILLESIKYCQKHKGLELYGYVIMSNHVHLIIGRSSESKLEDIIRDMKKFTSRRVIQAIHDNPQESRKEWMLWMFERAGKKNGNNKHYQFWRQDNCPKVLPTEKLLLQKLNYIHDNPVKEGLVQNQEDYLYSSAGNYMGRKYTLLDVMVV